MHMRDLEASPLPGHKARLQLVTARLSRLQQPVVLHVPTYRLVARYLAELAALFSNGSEIVVHQLVSPPWMPQPQLLDNLSNRFAHGRMRSSVLGDPARQCFQRLGRTAGDV